MVKRGSLTSRGRACLAGIVFTIASALAAPAIAVEPPAPGPQPQQQVPSGEPPPYFTNPTFQDAFEAAQQRLERQQQGRESPAGAAERLASRTDYQALTAAEALDIAEQAHGEAILEPAWDPLAAQPGSRLEGYLGDFAARIDVPGEPTDSLLETTLPLRARTDSGQIAPVDQELVADEGAFAPANPITELSMPDDLPGQITLPEAGIGIEPLGVDATPARLAGETTAFYANALTDTDIAVRALPTGVSVDYVLRSLRSPEDFSLQLSLPAGTELEQRGEDGAALVRDGEAIGRIAPPAAWDADGQDIPSRGRSRGPPLPSRSATGGAMCSIRRISIRPSYSRISAAGPTSRVGGRSKIPTNPNAGRASPAMGSGAAASIRLACNTYGTWAAAMSSRPTRWTAGSIPRPGPRHTSTPPSTTLSTSGGHTTGGPLIR